MPRRNYTERLAYNRQFIADLRTQRRNNGLCLTCGQPSRQGKTECHECRQRRIQQRDERKRRAVEYLGGQCVDCGLRTDIIAVYDFHHKDSDGKTSGIADFLKRKKPWKKLQEELDKCVLLCANRHRIRHALEDDDETSL